VTRSLKATLQSRVLPTWVTVRVQVREMPDEFVAVPHRGLWIQLVLMLPVAVRCVGTMGPRIACEPRGRQACAD
jgi:hypothetical protein